MKAELITIWTRQDGQTMMTVVADGRATDYEIPKPVMRFLAKELVDKL